MNRSGFRNKEFINTSRRILNSTGAHGHQPRMGAPVLKISNVLPNRSILHQVHMQRSPEGREVPRLLKDLAAASMGAIWRKMFVQKSYF